MVIRHPYLLMVALHEIIAGPFGSGCCSNFLKCRFCNSPARSSIRHVCPSGRGGRTTRCRELAHQSIEEFLRKKHLCSPCLSHSILASTCIDDCLHGPPVGQPLEVQTISIHAYAAMSWEIHFQDADVPEGENDLFHHKLPFIFDDDDMTPSLAFRIWMDIAKQLAKLLPNHHPMNPTLGAVTNAQEPPIFLAAMFGVNVLLDLLATSAIKTDWNQRNEMGHTAVYLAATSGNASTVPTLINQGAEVNVECGMRGSPLHVACFRGRPSRRRQRAPLPQRLQHMRKQVQECFGRFRSRRPRGCHYHSFSRGNDQDG